MKTLILIVLTLGLYSCINHVTKIDDVAEHLRKINPELNPYAEVIPTSIKKANGFDNIVIQVVFKGDPNRDLTKAIFKTKEGIFVENNQQEYTSDALRAPIQSEKAISARLRTSTTLGTHIINIEIPTVLTTFVVVNFDSSYATKISVSKNKPFVVSNYKDEIQLKAALTASPGLPHKGTKVVFNVIANGRTLSTEDSNASDYFRDLTTTDANGLASVFFTPGALNGFTGPASYEVSAIKEDKQPLVSKGSFQIVNP